ncbi:MAG: hypothetical protein P4L40_19440 [Terracidiphilus sp.]|nr:hypothetical protein [Terracidiphilus sp.]
MRTSYEVLTGVTIPDGDLSRLKAVKEGSDLRSGLVHVADGLDSAPHTLAGIVRYATVACVFWCVCVCVGVCCVGVCVGGWLGFAGNKRARANRGSSYLWGGARLVCVSF